MRAGLAVPHFHEDQVFPVAGDKVDFTAAAKVIGLEVGKALRGKEVPGKRFKVCAFFTPATRVHAGHAGA